MKANGVEAAIFPVDGGESIFVVLDELGSNLRRGLSSAAGPTA